MRIILPQTADNNEILNADTLEVIGRIESSPTADCTVIGNGKVANLPTLEMNLAFVYGNDVQIVKAKPLSE